jgi:hypothetical protein
MIVRAATAQNLPYLVLAIVEVISDGFRQRLHYVDLSAATDTIYSTLLSSFDEARGPAKNLGGKRAVA